MKNQIIITLGREHGSGGHYIADMIAQELGIKLYDKDSIEKEIVSEGYSGEMIRKMDEKPVNFFASRRIGKYSNSLEVNVAEKTFAMLRDKAANGESFLIIGRCSDQVLKGNPNMLSIFICGNQQAKVGRVMLPGRFHSARTSAATRHPSARAPTSSALRLRPRAAIPLAGAATASTACLRRSLSWQSPRPTYSCAICKRKKERSAIP